MVTQNLATQAILSVMGGKKSFCKFLSANDTGKTGGHQAGIYIAKPAVPIIFDHPFEKGLNHDRWVNIEWQDGILFKDSMKLDFVIGFNQSYY